MIGERLQEIRKDRGDTQADLAGKLHVSISTIKSWEGDKSSPSHDMLVSICRLYSVTSDYLLGLIDTDPMLSKENYDQLTPKNQEMVHFFEEFMLFQQKRKP